MRRRSLAAWLALLAIALQAFWPLIAHAKPRSVTLVPLCTEAGETHDLEVETGGGDGAHAEHCKACPVGAVALASGSLPFFMQFVSSAPHRVAPEAAQPRFCPYARSRAPPSFLAVEVISDNQEKTNEKGVVLRPRA
jgi:Protein of unknown function (DUF2946)